MAPAPDRLRREARFHDEAFASGARRVVDKYYRAAAPAEACYADLIRRRAPGAEVLEYGCGPGSAAFDLAALGARVTGIDISAVGIQQATEEARRRGLGERLTFRQMNAEALEFADGTFDLVCGTGILHHVDLGVAPAQVRRVLHEQGTAVFFEPLGHNPFINLYRRLTPRLRTADEHPLRLADVARIRAAFSASTARYFGLSTLLATPLQPAPGGALLRGLEALDRVVLRLPLVRRFAWIVVLDLSASV